VNDFWDDLKRQRRIEEMASTLDMARFEELLGMSLETPPPPSPPTELEQHLQVALDVANGADAPDEMAQWALVVLESVGVCPRARRVEPFLVPHSNSTALYCLTGRAWNTEPMSYPQSYSGRYFLGSAG
jgi:hypothetical protein